MKKVWMNHTNKLPDYNSYQDSDFDNLIIWFWCNDDVSVIWGTSNAMSI